ncbi:tautomerase family protein [Ensifer aridi]|uniref:tautomerase family protein n=1 Tax=Ensifer aridi TaxID=1708715 RepID=UPI0003FC96A5|nr:tautomerase family protein [Ensifer aridi]
MPLLKINLVKGRSDQAVDLLLDCIHDAIVSAFSVPPTDRYQVVYQHESAHLHLLDTGLGLERSNEVVLIEVISRARTQAQKEEFYRLVCDLLQANCSTAPSDIVIVFTENGDADWSFGNGRAQFLTGELQ